MRRRVAVLVVTALWGAAFAAWAALGGWASAAPSQQIVQVPVQAPEEAAQSSLAAALAFFNGSADPDCVRGGPIACVAVRSTPEQAALGIASFSVSEAGSGGQGFFGRDIEGAWQHWFGRQNPTYQLLFLPGTVMVCAGGSTLNVRAGPGTAYEVIGELADGETATAEQFVLTSPGTNAGGWYLLSGPVAGWAYGRWLADPAANPPGQPPCFLHDLFES